MMTTRRWLLAALIAVGLGLMSFQATLAKEIVQVTISGPGFSGEVDMSHAEALMRFAELEFEATPDDVESEIYDSYYVIQLHIGYEDEIVATDVYHYYPLSETGTGYIYYADVINGFSTAEGQWYRLTDESDRMLRDVLFTEIVRQSTGVEMASNLNDGG